MSSTICVVDKCFNKGVHRFPDDDLQKLKWLNILNCPTNYLTNDVSICSEHFVESDFKKDVTGNAGLPIDKRILRKYAVPSLFPGGVTGIKKSNQINKIYEKNINKVQHILSAHQGAKKIVHENVSCNNCKKELRGYRYKCVQCIDYDLCSACEMSRIHSEHVVVRLPKPLPYKLLQDVLAPLKSIFMIQKNDGNTNGIKDVLTENFQPNRNTETKQKFESELDSYPVEFLEEDSFDSSEWEPTLPLKPLAQQPALKIKSMEIFKVDPEEENMNFNLGNVPMKIYGSKVKNKSANETSDGDQMNDQVLNNSVNESQNSDFFKVERIDEVEEMLEEEYLEDVKFFDFDTE